MIKMRRSLFLVLMATLVLSWVINILALVYFSKQNLVIRVVDGDSLDLKDGRRIRLLGIDAPELGQCMSYDAKERLNQLTLNRRLKLRDIVTDDYGRILANVFAGKSLVNKVLVEEGLAKFVFVKSPYYEEIKRAGNYAKNQKMGIYSPLCRLTDPSSPECNIKGNIREGRKIYHLSNCPNYKEVIIDESFADRWFCSEDEATRAGFLKASGC